MWSLWRWARRAVCPCGAGGLCLAPAHTGVCVCLCRQCGPASPTKVGSLASARARTEPLHHGGGEGPMTF